MRFLYAAYAVTWVIHIFYLMALTRGFQRVREDVEDLERK